MIHKMFLILNLIFFGTLEATIASDGIVGSLQLTGGEVQCLGKRCIYSPVNKTPVMLVENIKKSVWGQSYYRIPQVEGYLQTGDANSVVEFWHSDPAILAEMKKYAVENDRNISTRPPIVVNFRLQIYAITRSGLDEFGFGLGGIFDGPVPADTAHGTLVSGSTSALLSTAFGNLTNHMFNLKLDMARSKGQAYAFIDYPFTIFNGDTINRSDIQPIYYKGVTNTISEDAGYRLSGQVFVNGADNRQVIIKNLSFYYAEDVNNPLTATNKDEATGTLAAQVASLVRKAEITQDRFFLTAGVPAVLNTKRATLEAFGKQNGFPLFYGKKHLNEEVFLMAFLSCDPRPFGESATAGQLDKVPRFSQDDLVQMPAGNEQSLQKIFAAPQLEVTAGPQHALGQKIEFRLDPQLATLNTYNRTAVVTVTGEGVPDDFHKPVEIQNLMLSPLVLPSLRKEPGKGLDIMTLDLKIELLDADLDNQNTTGTRGVVYHLLYMPEMQLVKINGMELIGSNEKKEKSRPSKSTSELSDDDFFY